jgi:hypothetical protein
MGLDIYSDMGLLEPDESPEEESEGAEENEEEKLSVKKWNPLHMGSNFSSKGVPAEPIPDGELSV